MWVPDHHLLSRPHAARHRRSVCGSRVFGNS
nr:MAG TPA: hypothetical protein [Caudoviricetes sp.]